MSSDLALFRRLIDIGIALSVEKDTNKLMEIILLEAKDISNADGGTLYIRTKDDTLEFEIMHTDSLDVVQGGTSGVEITIPAVQMYLEDGSPNNQQIVASAALSGDTLNLRDAYDSTEFDFSGTKRFDEGNNYRTRSVLTVPLKDSQGDVIGVLQLLNAMATDGQVIDFSEQIQPLIEALASQAAVALDNALLIESQENLLDAFITLMARAVDAKSPHTGGHCERVPELTKQPVRQLRGLLLTLT
jgi:GAF domain-containing protein